jgi:hypothetical protein
MQTYKNTTPTSCVYDAFIRAGLPVEERMMHGIKSYEVVELLEANGWIVLYKGQHFVPSDKPVIVLRDWKKDFSHTEFHESCSTIMDYDPASIGAIAYKK